MLRLRASGKSDREVAETLSVSHRTVTTHVTTILIKLAAANRVQAVAGAIQQNVL